AAATIVAAAAAAVANAAARPWSLCRRCWSTRTVVDNASWGEGATAARTRSRRPQVQQLLETTLRLEHGSHRSQSTGTIGAFSVSRSWEPLPSLRCHCSRPPAGDTVTAAPTAARTRSCYRSQPPCPEPMLTPPPEHRKGQSAGGNAATVSLFWTPEPPAAATTCRAQEPKPPSPFSAIKEPPPASPNRWSHDATFSDSRNRSRCQSTGATERWSHGRPR
ncbi:Hypothetical predicted protein, partial [Marmota monax]